MSIFYHFVLIPIWSRKNPLATLSDLIVTPGYLKGGPSNLISAQSNLKGTLTDLLTLKMTSQVHQRTPQKPNKSNRVRTIDAFSCVLVLQILLVIFFTQCFVLLLLKCSSNCLVLTFHTLTYPYFAQNRYFFMISTHLWPTDGRTDTPSYRDARSHLKSTKYSVHSFCSLQNQPDE